MDGRRWGSLLTESRKMLGMTRRTEEGGGRGCKGDLAEPGSAGVGGSARIETHWMASKCSDELGDLSKPREGASRAQRDRRARGWSLVMQGCKRATGSLQLTHSSARLCVLLPHRVSPEVGLQNLI